MAGNYLDDAMLTDGVDEPTQWELDAVQKVKDWAEALETLQAQDELNLAIMVLKKHGINVTDQVMHPQMDKVLTISTGHVTEATAERLSKDNIPGTIVFEKGVYGWLLWTGIEPDEETLAGIPVELWQVIQFAKSLGCEWLMLDRDADQITALEVWDW
ncbi:hypothetical protein [Brucella intermedia]|uniref:DUF5983 family protein n=1 Tax=Brucella intermedia TaxID=94625 RepID=UPI003F5CDE2F